MIVRQTPRQAVITARDWGWRYAGRDAWAVRHLDLEVRAGERVLLLGASGAGKSTLLLALAGVLGGADEGTEEGMLLVGGAHPTRSAGSVGLVQQDPAAGIILARVGDDVAFGLENVGVAPAQIWLRVERALGEVGLDLALDHSTTTLSGGQQQRLALAGVLAMMEAGGPAPVLLLDEPTANLDPAGVRIVRAAVESVVADRSTTLVVVEHRVEVWLDLIDRVVVVGPSGVVADGTPGVVFAEHGAALAEAGVWVPGIDARVPVPGTSLPDGGPSQMGQPEPSPLSHLEPFPASRVPGTRPSGAVVAPRADLLDGVRFSTMCPVDEAVPSASRLAAGEPTVLAAVDLTMGYSAAEPVKRHINLAIPGGVSTVITGPNGCGKSTLAWTLAGLLPALGGRVVAGTGLTPSPATRRQRQLADLSDPHMWTSEQLLTRIGTVFQNPEYQFVSTTVREELAVGLRALRVPAHRVTARVDELLDQLHLTPLASANPYTLSGGEKRRLSVGTVLATSPAVIILDEPTFGQDRTTWRDLVAFIRQVVAEGRTVVSVTHDAAYIEALGDNRVDLEGLT